MLKLSRVEYIKLRKKPFRGEPKLRKSKLFKSMIRTYEPPSLFTTFFFIENLDQFRLFACSGYVEARKGFIDAGIHKYSTPALTKIVPFLDHNLLYLEFDRSTYVHSVDWGIPEESPYTRPPCK